MKKIIFAALAFVLLSVSCDSAKVVKVEVENPLAVERVLETVEIEWGALTAKVPELTADNVIVLDINGKQIPSQVVYNGQEEPQLLIFQATVKSSDMSPYTVKAGVREEYPVEAFGRYVPERLDDYAWENNMVAHRLYGPALEKELVTPGIDVWSKRTPNLVIDKWYAAGHYHDDGGDGMDCYKVGPTLGGGASVPFVDGNLCMSRNYATQRTLDNGPIRTSFELTYAPFAAGDMTVSLVKIISLDANTRFSRMINTYAGDFELLPIAAGIVVHDGARVTLGANSVALTEPASDSKDPVRDGDISLAVILPGANATLETAGHAVAVIDVKPDAPFSYWSGTGWSQGGVADDQAWLAMVEAEAARIANPLTVTLK